METLNHILNRLFGNNGRRYYKRIIDDYNKGDWNFDIKTLVEYQKIRQAVAFSFSSKGYRYQRTRIVTDTVEFEEEMKRYYNLQIIPIREIKKDIMLSRKALMVKFGYITEGNQYCQKAGYKCENCLNYEGGCKMVIDYSTNQIKRITKIFELAYTNLGRKICVEQVKQGLKYL